MKDRHSGPDKDDPHVTFGEAPAISRVGITNGGRRPFEDDGPPVKRTMPEALLPCGRRARMWRVTRRISEADSEGKNEAAVPVRRYY